MEKVIFPDVESVLVAGLKAALAERSEEYAQGVHVGTIKPAPDVNPYPSRIITVRSDGGPQLDDVRKQERVGMIISCDTYADANRLSRLIEALVKTLVGEQLKLVTVVLSPVRMAEVGTQEVRYMTLEVISKGTAL